VTVNVLSQKALTVIGVVILPCLLACQKSTRKDAAPRPSAAVEQPAPRIKLSQARYELGPFVQDEEVHGSIVLSNSGSLPLQIDTVEPSRFCSGNVTPSTVAPGASAQVEVTCRSDLYGPLSEHLVIRSNDPATSKAALDLVGNVTPILAFDTTNVDLKMPFGEDRNQEVKVEGSMLDKARIKLVSPSIPDVDIESLPASAGKIRGFRIHCKGRKPGMNVGNLIISTGLERPKEVAIPYACKVAGTLEVSPTNPYFNLKVSGPKYLFIQVRSSQPHFEVQAVHVTEGPFAATFEHAPEGEFFRVKVTVLYDHIEDDTHGVTGKLVIVSNDRTEPQKEMPLFGFGQVNRATPLAPQ
jgi:hypothetical protein